MALYSSQRKSLKGSRMLRIAKLGLIVSNGMLLYFLATPFLPLDAGNVVLVLLEAGHQVASSLVGPV